MLKICATIFVLVSLCFSQQINNLRQINPSAGEEIIRKAQEAAGLSLPLKSFQLKLNKVSKIVRTGETAPTNLRGKEVTYGNQEEITVLFPDKIRIISVNSENLAGVNFTITTTWSEKKFKQIQESEIFGKRQVTDTTESVSTDRLNQALGKNSLKKVNAKPIDNKVVFSNEMWLSVFPIILMHPIESQEKFEYIGRAQAGEQTANVVQTNSPNGDKVQLFFDEKTSNLLLMIAKGKNQFGEYEDKYYFSNREKRDNVLIPTKVKYERKFTSTNGGLPNITYTYIDIEGFKVNPEVKPDIFKVN